MSKSSKTGKPKTGKRGADRRASLGAQLSGMWPALVQGDPKAVHETRKLTRKVGAELSVTGAPKKVRRAWRDLRRAVAPLRDHDVAGEHLAAALEEQGRPPHEIADFRRDWQRRRAELLAGVLRDRWPDHLISGISLVGMSVPEFVVATLLVLAFSIAVPVFPAVVLDDASAPLRDLLPADDRWIHAHGSRGHGRSHVMPALIPPYATVPVLGGRLALGTWQSICLVDLNVDNPVRTVRLSFLAG